MASDMMPAGMPSAARRFDPVRQMQRAQADLSRLFGRFCSPPASRHFRAPR